ncbi:Ig-like domain-containing protein [Shewanella sedimentimangrovi]|uniref:Thrombospondin type 3 repeat-containing protein n=1 Tax=Shewanella sedimentimangrovi TaxID=2814293 RepID=A0ABX7R383_9GAMM|nr:Ig-like domain-containing protein [Shewanella sedimentimangrovi]QSX38253.1 thrombospondin type 3 repeat-containing protein [Shewanella sedimentimangrovi]
MMRWLIWILLIGLCPAQSLFAASLTKKVTIVDDTASDKGFVNDADNLVFFQPVHPTLSGFVTQANGKWAFTTSDGAGSSTVDAVGVQFNGAPALLGIPAESGTLTIGANNQIADLWTNRIFYRPVVFVSLEDPNLNNGVSIVPTAPITAGNQFLFDVNQATGFNADLAGAKVHYLIAEEGWHRLADGRMLLISSAEVKHTGFSGQTIALGASFETAVTVAQLQRPMLYKSSGFRQLNDMAVYQGATVTEGVGNFDSITLRLMQETAVEQANSDTVYAGRVGFMVLGNISSIANTFKLVKDTNTNIRGGSYLTVPQSNFQFFPHSAAATPLLNRAACAEDDDVQNFCAYLSMPVDAMSRGVFNTPRLPYMDSNFDPLQMERTFYSEKEWDWEPVIAQEMMNPVSDVDQRPIVGTLAKMFPNFVADRGWNDVIIGSDDHWHWFATYHYNTCVFDSMNTACVDYAPGNTIIEDKPIEWTASMNWFDLEPGSNFSGNTHPSSSNSQFLLAVQDNNRRDHVEFYERLTPEDWAAKQTLDYLNLGGSTMRTPLSPKSPSYNETKGLLESYAETWQFFGINVEASASEFFCGTCDGPLPGIDTGGYTDVWGLDIKVPTLLADRILNSPPWYSPQTTHPHVDKVGQNMRPGDYLFANIPYSIDATDFVWLRSATGQVSDAVVVASNQFGYQATADDANTFVTMCMTFRNSQRCGKWIKVGQIPFATNVKIKPQYAEPIAGSGLIGQYTYVAPNSNIYDGLEYQSLYQWQYALSDTWVDYVGENDITFQKSVAAGTVIRFCVTPRTHTQAGPTECSVGVKMQLDTDSDGIADDWDTDDDNDGYADWEDRFPKDASEYLDTDHDGIGNNADLDDDNDGLSDADEIVAGSDALNPDSDGDGTLDGVDPHPTVYGDLPDFDGDGIADIYDEDRDNDGVVDFFYQIDGTDALQTLVDENDVVLNWARIDDNPYQACTASQITVTSNADSGPGTLRQALIDLCASEPGADLNVISFNGPMTIMLESPLVIGKGMKIDGNKAVVLDGQNKTAIFAVAIADRMLKSQFPHLVGLTLRNGFSQGVDADAYTNFDAELGTYNKASAVHMYSSSFLLLEHVLIENMTAPVISGRSVELYLENSLVANVSGSDPALITDDGQISLFSSTLYNSESGALSVVGTGKAQLRNSLLLKGANGSTLCNVATWVQQTASWVEDSECGVTSTGYVELADPEYGDYRPVPGSANIDAGETGELPAGAVDLLGNNRVMGAYNPDNPEELGGPLYPKMDIGAIEYVYAGDFDGDGVVDSSDAFPNDATETTDSDSDGVGDNSDAFPNDANETLDTDSDGIGNNSDNDDDNDGVLDSEDAFPLDAAEWLDTDADGIGNNADTDDDNDNVPDSEDTFPLDASESVDTDKDGIGNNADSDDDNDGVLDAADAFPLDASEWLDADLDGIGNNADPDDDNDGVADVADAFPFNAAEWLDTDLDGIGNNADLDDDNDNVPDSADAFPLDAGESVDTDSDGIGNNADSDDDGDGVADSSDMFPLDASEWLDSDLDGIGNNLDTDDDNDGVLDIVDAFPFDASESVDTDSDGIGNNADSDDDNDGVVDTEDAFPLDAAESVDTDLDGIGNNADLDDDNDGVLDSNDAFPLDAAESVDTDADGIGNNVDLDDDNDGVLDAEDAFPLDATESVDTDSDGIGNNADSDDDNDGVLDTEDAFPLDASESVDTDSDGIGNNADLDDDNDGVADSEDAFPLDATESVDTDSDGIGNNADLDDDNDGVLDSDDAFPLDAAESADTDLDGIGNNADIDDDNDGVVDSDDAFPLDATESVDTDLDGTGNNADSDDDNDGMLDTEDAFPLDATESVDTDADGIGNNADTDDDNDGVVDSDDAFPLDAAESVDTDGDGIGNNADSDDDNDGVLDSEDAFPLDASESVDTDGDGIGNNADSDDDNDGVLDTEDTFPLDAAESVDTDLDGLGNNADSDDDNDGVVDSDDTFPLDATESVDTDGDGIGNNADPDDDNDGINDEDDAAPLDPSIGDTQKPVFAELAPLTFEATGPMTAVTLPEPQVTDNISTVLTISSDLAAELERGEHLITWTATDGAGNQATAEQLVTIVDTTAPVFDMLDTLVVNATGRLTDISTLLDISASDLVDGDITAALNGSSELASGAHELELGATDSSGNTATTTLSVHILPQLKLARSMTVEAGGEYLLPLQLTGEAPVYPVELNYSLLVDGQEVNSATATIDQGTQGELPVSVPTGLTLGRELTLKIDSVSHAFVGEDGQAQLQLTEQNQAPTFSAKVLQQGVATRLLDPLSGQVEIRLQVSDVNVNDSHSVSWQVVEQAFGGSIAEDGLSMTFDPSELSSGRYAVDVTVTETNTPAPLSSSRRIRFTVESLPQLSSEADTDGDGIVDSQEGYGDSDGDGIADYLDNDVDGSRLPVNSSTEPMQTTAGVQLALGNITSAIITGSGAGMTMDDLAEAVANDSGAADSNDSHFSQMAAVLDFTLSGTFQAGQSVAVVFPMPRGTALPEDAVYRKYTPQQGWYDFVEDANNSISSAPLADGECPQVGADSFEPGLVAGYQCVQLLLQDGGPNDADGTANGVIEDPGVISVLSQNQLPVAQADSAAILDSQVLVIDVLANDTDPDGDSLSVIGASVDNGTVELLADNTLRYTPSSGFSGEAMISYQVSDGFGGSAQGQVIVTVNLTPVTEPDTPAPKSHGGSVPPWSLLLLGMALCTRRRAA